MHSRCPHSQGGIYPACQHKSNGDFLKSLQSNDTPHPVVHHANGIPTNTVANQYPGELRVDYCPANTSSTALEEDGVGRDQHYSESESKQQRSNPLLYAMLKANSPYCSTIQYLNTQSTSSEKTDANTERPKSQQVQMKGEYTQAKNVNCSRGTNFTYHQRWFCSPSLSGQLPNELPTDDQIWDCIENKRECYTNVSTWQSRTYGSMTTNENDRNSAPQSYSVRHLITSVSEEDAKTETLNFSVIELYTAADGQALEDSSKTSKANVALNTKSAFASEKHSTGTVASAADYSKHALKNESGNKSACIDFGLPFTNACRKDVCSDDCGDKRFFESSDESFHSKWNKYIGNDGATLHYSLTALKELIASLEKVEIIAEVDNLSEVILQQYWNGDIDNVHFFTSTEYPQIMVKVAATCTKNEDGSPVVLTALSGMTLDQLTGKDPNHLFNGSSSHHHEYKSPWLNINKNLDKMDTVPGVYCAIQSMTEQEKGDINPEPVEAVGLASAQGVTDVSEEVQSQQHLIVYGTSECSSFPKSEDSNTKMRDTDNIQPGHIASKELIGHSKIFSCPATQWLCNRSCEDVRKDGLHVELFQNVFKEHSFENEQEQADFVNNLKDPQYEDISDDDKSQLLTKLPNSEHEQLSVLPSFEDVQYEDISEDENPQIENMAVEIASPKQLPENCKQLTFKNEGYGHVQGLAQKDRTDNQMDDDWIFIPISMSDLTFEPDEAAQDDPGVIVLQDSETGDSKCLDDTSTEEHRLHQPASSLVPDTVCSEIEVFDTFESFLQAKTAQFKGESSRTTPTYKMDPETESHKAQNRQESYSEPEDSCETDDSCDYSPVSECSHLRAKRHLLKMSAPLLLDKNDSEPEKSKTTNMQISQTRGITLQKLKELIDAQAGSKHFQPKSNRQKVSKKADVIILDSDTEDESDQNCKQKAKSSEDREFPCSQQRGHLLETGDNLCAAFKEKLKKNILPYVDSPAPQHQSRLDDTKVKELTQDRYSDLSHCTETSGRQIETKSGLEHVQHETNSQNISTQESVIIIDSDAEDESDKNYEKANCKRLLFSGSEDGGEIRQTEQLTEAKGDSEHIQQETNRQTTSIRAVFHDSDKVVKKGRICKGKATVSSGSAETLNSLYGTTNKKPQETTLPSKDSSNKLPQSAPKKADSVLCPRLVIPRLFVQKASQSRTYLILSKDSKFRISKYETEAPKTPRGTRKKVVSRDSDRNEQDKCVSRQPPLSSQEDPSTSISSLTSRDGQHPDVRQSSYSSKGLSQSAESSAFPSLPKYKPGTSDPTHLPSSKLKCSRSCSNTLTLDSPHCPTKDPARPAHIQLPAKKRAISNWSESYVPLRRDRKSSLGMETSRSASYDSKRNARPASSHRGRAPRRRRKSHNSTTPLMKRARFEAMQWTKETNRDNSRKQRSSVGKGFKWLERPTTGYGRDMKRCRSLPDPMSETCQC